MEIRQFKTRQRGVMNFSVVGLGTAPIGDLYAKLDEKTAISTVEQALACGVTLFDTSPHYGNGLAEVRLGSGLRHAGRNGLLNQRRLGRAQDSTVAGTLAANLYLQRNYALQQQNDDLIAALSLDQVNAALRAYIDPLRWVMVWAGDFKP